MKIIFSCILKYYKKPLFIKLKIIPIFKLLISNLKIEYKTNNIIEILSTQRI